ncbi:MAG: hypothetical protein GY788_21125 [bacterium]|nr:hypothetical protein [bacterium]
MGQQEVVGIAASAVTALDTDYTPVFVGAFTTPEARAVGIPTNGYLSWLSLVFDTIAGGATSATFYISGKESMNHAFSKVVTESIVLGDDDPTEGGIAEGMGIHYRESAVSTAGQVVVAIKLNAGTANVTARVFHTSYQ